MKLIKEQVVEDLHPALAETTNEGNLPTTSLSKFKDVQSLCKAYNSLEAEFTKRCQRISELERELEILKKETNCDLKDGVKVDFDNEKSQVDKNNEDLLPLEEKTDLSQKDNFTTEKVSGGVDKTQVGALNTPDGQNYPIKERSSYLENGNDWSEIFEFFRKFPDACLSGEEIYKMAINKGTMDLNGLQNAYIQVLLDRINQTENRLNDQDYLYTLITNDLKEKVIKEYLQSIKDDKKIMLMGAMGEIPVTPPIRPKNFAEASRLAKNIIKIK